MAAEQKKTEDKKAADKRALSITAVGLPGRWRAGRYFTADAATVPLGELSDAEIEALRADPHLKIEGVTLD